MARYELSSVPWMSDGEPPFAIVTTDDSGVPIRIQRHPNTDAIGQAMADDLIANFTAEPEGLPLNRLAVSYGGLQEIDAAGVPVVQRESASRATLRLYLAEADTGFDGHLGLVFPSRLPLVVFAATSLDEGAVDAVAVADTPALVDLAESFTGRSQCAQVARQHLLEVTELKGTVLVALLDGLPAGHPVAALAERVQKQTLVRVARRALRRD